MQSAPNPQDQEILNRLERDENEYRNHPVWRRLGCTPEQFAKSVREQVAKSGISQKEWQEKLAACRQKIETTVREQKRQYQVTNLRILSGIRA